MPTFPAAFLGLLFSVLLQLPTDASAATGIQMLPPMQSTDMDKSCIKLQGNKLLSWDGENPIKCNYGITTDGAGRTLFSRDGAAECCSNGNYTLALSEQTVSTGKMASIQFHNAGAHEGYFRLASNGVRRFQLGDNQGATMGLQLSGALQVDGAGVSSIQGSLAIGTASPWGKLHVIGGRTFLQAASEPYGLGVGYNASSGYVYFGAASASPTPDAVISNASGTALARFTHEGRVGIGAVPDATTKLGVAGTIKSTTKSNAYVVGPAEMKAHHPDCDMFAGYLAPEQSSNQMQCTSACNRFCGSKGYSGGTIVEWEPVSWGAHAQCLCSP